MPTSPTVIPAPSPVRAVRGDAGEGGFSLSEVLVALGVASILFVAALSMLALDNRVFHRDDAVLEISREARHTLDRIEQDLLMAGYLVDSRTIADNGPDGTASTSDDIVGQGKIVHAGPWEIAFNSDRDSAVEAIQDGTTGDALPTGYAPVTFFTGAETVRFTLDSNGDGVLNSSDRGDEIEETLTQNTGLYLLRRETYGFNGTNNVNPAGVLGLVRGPVNYPNGVRPPPLFLYWGRFDTDAALDLWGDNGAGGGTAGNGVLEAGELAALTAVTDEDADDDNVLDAGEDRNGNGTLERRISELIDQVEVRVTVETPHADMEYRDAVRSSTSVPFRHRVVTLSTIIKPRNTDLAGGACGDDPDPTSSPVLANACAHALADGKVRMTWTLSGDDGSGETDVEKYIIFRTDEDNIFGPTPYDEVLRNTGTWDDDWVEMRTWPPKQYWYRPRAMDCTPRLSVGDAVAGPYPAAVGAAYPSEVDVLDVPGDDGTNLDVLMSASIDDPTNTSTYGGDVDEYHVYRSTNDDYRCVPPVNTNPIAAAGATSYAFRDNATNSSSGLTAGTLYFYWVRTVDDEGNVSPYSPRYCGRGFAGPAFPRERAARVVTYASNDHPVELMFVPREDNEAAGYNPRLIDYRIYRADSSRVDVSIGYTTGDRVATIRPHGTVFAVGGTSAAKSWRSLDGGQSSRQATNAIVNQDNAVSFGSFLRAIVVSSGGDAFHSSDGGVHWTAGASNTLQDLFDVAHLTEETAVAVGRAGEIIRTTDGGANWTQISSGATTDFRGVAAAGDTVLAVGESGLAVLSTDGGTSFTALTFTTDDMDGACAVEIGGAVRLYAGGEDQVFRSTDGGTSWSAIPLTGAGAVRGLACAKNGVVYAVGAGGVYRSAGGSSFAPESVSAANVLDVSTTDGVLAWATDENGRLHRRLNDGSWTTVLLDGAAEPIRGVASRPEVAWEDTATATAASGTSYFYVVTARYDQGVTALDGESGLLADRPAADEVPDDALAQVLVDSCQNIEVSATMP